MGWIKDPSLLVHLPKGLAKPGTKLGDEGEMEEDEATAEAEKRFWEAVRRGKKCLKYVETEEVQDLFEENERYIQGRRPKGRRRIQEVAYGGDF